MLTSDKMLIIAGIIILVIILGKMRAKQAKEKELKMIAEDKLRDEALNQALANDLCEGSAMNATIETLPYEVDYHQGQRESSNLKEEKIMLQITACSKLSKRKFMIELRDRVKIGKAKENPIVVKGQNVLPVQCEIFDYRHDVYVRDYSERGTLLIRKRQQVAIGHKGIRMKTGDKLIIENTTLEVTILGHRE